MSIKNYSSVFYFILFCIVFYFFAKVHPLFVFDTDDWLYVQDSRDGQAWPVWELWNPTKIFPEFLMPAVSWLSLIFVYPFSNDYIGSLSIGYAFSLSVFVLSSAIFLHRLLNVIFKSSFFESFLCTVLFVAFLFFPIFKKDTVYLLHAADVTCVFNYTIPALLNISLCFFLLYSDSKALLDGVFKKLSILIFVLYFCLNSNLFQSIILVSFAIASIIISLISNWKKTKTLGVITLIKDNYLFAGIVLYWIVVLLYEANGERASEAHSDLFSLSYLDTLSCLWLRIKRLHSFYLFLLLTNLLGGLLYFLRSRKNKVNHEDLNYIRVIKLLFISFVVTLTFVFLLCSKVGASYIARPDVAISYLISLLGMSIISVMYLLKRIKVLITIFPILVMIVAFYTIFSSVKYSETSYISGPISAAKQIGSDIVDKIVNAADNGLEHIEISIPKFNDGDNFPLANYGVNRIPKALFFHSIIRKQIDVKFILDPSMNKKYHIN